MNVYLVPAGPARHELYCEVAAVSPVEHEGPPQSLWGRLTAVFRRALAEGEAERRGEAEHAQHSRLRRWITRQLAEAVAEQRLLWQLRKQSDAALFYPDDLAERDAVQASRQLLTSDRDKHRRWCVIDALLTVATTPIALLPGPNVFAYYFIFRTVGHFLSMRGAQQGLTSARWTNRASPELGALRRALQWPSETRCPEIERIAAALQLERLPAFVEGVADTAP